MATRKRCTECRQRFTSTARGPIVQRVCGAACRASRDRKLARARRRREIVEFRAEERVRQAEHRGQPPVCHAPSSARNQPELLDEVVDFVDRSLRLSRAIMMRDITVICRSKRASVG